MQALPLVLWQGQHRLLNVICFDQLREVGQPETGCFLLHVPEPPGLDYLGLLHAADAVFRIAVHDWVLDTLLGDVTLNQALKERGT